MYSMCYLNKQNAHFNILTFEIEVNNMTFSACMSAVKTLTLYGQTDSRQKRIYMCLSCSKRSQITITKLFIYQLQSLNYTIIVQL